jgi:hypothetical protein
MSLIVSRQCGFYKLGCRSNATTLRNNAILEISVDLLERDLAHVWIWLRPVSGHFSNSSISWETSCLERSTP